MNFARSTVHNGVVRLLLSPPAETGNKALKHYLFFLRLLDVFRDKIFVFFSVILASLCRFRRRRRTINR